MADSGPARCGVCDLLFPDAVALSRHMKLKHELVIPASDMDFIPHVEYDDSGQKKARPYKQKPYIPMNDYEG